MGIKARGISVYRGGKSTHLRMDYIKVWRETDPSTATDPESVWCPNSARGRKAHLCDGVRVRRLFELLLPLSAVANKLVAFGNRQVVQHGNLLVDHLDFGVALAVLAEELLRERLRLLDGRLTGRKLAELFSIDRQLELSENRAEGGALLGRQALRVEVDRQAADRVLGRVEKVRLEELDHLGLLQLLDELGVAEALLKVVPSRVDGQPQRARSARGRDDRFSAANGCEERERSRGTHSCHMFLWSSSLRLTTAALYFSNSTSVISASFVRNSSQKALIRDST